MKWRTQISPRGKLWYAKLRGYSLTVEYRAHSGWTSCVYYPDKDGRPIRESGMTRRKLASLEAAQAECQNDLDWFEKRWKQKQKERSMRGRSVIASN